MRLLVADTLTDALSRATTFEYDLAGRITRQILPDHREITYSYDANGNLTSLTPPGSPPHVFSHTLVDLARYFRGTGHILRFIEFMDVGNLNQWKMDQVVPSAELIKQIDRVFPLQSAEPNYYGEVASRYRYLDGNGEIGGISSVTEPFCGNCTRARLSPEGEVYTCLFASEGLDLKGPLRAGASDQEMEELIASLWSRRADRYSEERAQLAGKPQPRKVEMYHIGG
jgi:cyclic pyranopterin phosphate synthase